MPRYGELLAKLASGKELSIGEQNELRVLGNQQEAATATVNAWSGATTNLDANLFQSYSPVSFSVLPHECAALYQLSATAQVIPNNSWTAVTADTHADVPGATWSEGLAIDEANSRILVTGTAKESVVLCVAWASWAGNTTGVRGIKWLANDGSSVTIMRSAAEISHAGGYSQVEVVHMRKVPTTHTYYYIQVYQDSGGNLALDGAYHAMARLR